MIIGIPKEIKNNEYRVALVPSGAEALVEAGHTVLIETGAGQGTASRTSEYKAAGAEIVPTFQEVFAPRRHDHEGERAAAGRIRRFCVPARSCSPISILPPTKH